jgi:hypothetical protein
VLVITQAPMMMRSFGFSSTFNAMSVLPCRHSREKLLRRNRIMSGSRQPLRPVAADRPAILSDHG